MSRFLNLSPDAADDLDAIVGWILDKGNSAATAVRVLEFVRHVADVLASRPILGS